MNERQRTMLRILLESRDKFLSSQQLADRLGCSEKTVRNDSKVLDLWLSEHSHATLSRKPNIGFQLEISSTEREELLNTLYHASTGSTNDEMDEKNRLVRILELLLVEKKSLTLQKLSDLFFVNKAVIKKDLEKIEGFLAKSNLQLTTKKKLGIEVEGAEQNWRQAISKVPAFVESTASRMQFWEQFFEKQDVQTIKQSLEDANTLNTNPYTDETLQNLTVHMLIAVKRLKQGHSIQLPEAELDSILTKREYATAEDVMKKMEHHFAIRFPQQEMAYIALHFLGGRVQHAPEAGNEVDVDVQELTATLVSQLSHMMHIPFSHDEDLFRGLHVHLQSTMNRIRHRLSVTNPILDEIKRMYPYMFDTIMNEIIHVNQSRDLQIPEEEAAYLTLHFQASLERLQRKSGSNKKTIIVCPMGIGASVLLRTKLERKFHSLDILESVSINKINQYTAADIDFIISTVPISTTTLPVVQVTPLLTAEEENKLQAFIEELSSQKATSGTAQHTGTLPYLRELVKEELIVMNLKYSHPYEVIEALTTRLEEHGYVSKEYIESSIIREQHSSTNIGGGIAIPHGDPSYIKKSAIAVGILNKPLLWGKEYVSLVLTLATKPEEYTTTRELFTEIGQLTDHPLQMTNLIKQKTPEEFIKNL
ncbi:BglG family transcription antiterminator [Neobacillus rhizosphaerae]|uniref:BglG family transcription antiterminator n=1 Tax=Neobacillus rhizosphaerae TaxID=2880965 RepID=UPI003D29EC28